MVTPLSLYSFAAVVLLLALALTRVTRVTLRDVLADLSVSLAGTFLLLMTSVGLFALAGPLGAADRWRDAGSFALLSSPIVAVAALRFRGVGGVVRALAAGSLGVVAVVLWLTLNFRGPRGGWTAAELAWALPGAAMAVVAGACLGWWSKRRPADDSGGG